MHFIIPSLVLRSYEYLVFVNNRIQLCFRHDFCKLTLAYLYRESGPLYGCVLKITSSGDNNASALLIIAEARERFRLLDVHTEVSG